MPFFFLMYILFTSFLLLFQSQNPSLYLDSDYVSIKPYININLYLSQVTFFLFTNAIIQFLYCAPFLSQSATRLYMEDYCDKGPFNFGNFKPLASWPTKIMCYY